MAATAKTAAEKSSKSASDSSGFSAAERAAMKERAEELRSSGRGGAKKAEESQACLDKIAEMAPSDRRLAERMHALMTSAAPALTSKTWYGMPAYANADGKVVCFFKPADKFGARYATFGFSDLAALDDGNVWASEFAITDLTQADEARMEKLIKQAVSGSTARAADPRGHSQAS